MRLYDISRQDIVQVLKEADKSEPTIKGRTNAFCKVNERMLRVTYIEEARQLEIVTVTPLEE